MILCRRTGNRGSIGPPYKGKQRVLCLFLGDYDDPYLMAMSRVFSG